MELFSEILPGIYLLKAPFSTIWSAVFLVEGNGRVLIDSGASAAGVDEHIVPALKELGLELSDIDYLINTHSHGDHMGGNARILELAPSIKLVAFEGAVDKVENPLKYNIKTRATYPNFSPAPAKSFPGHTPDIVLKDGEVLADRLQIVYTPGHDTECISLLDKPTNAIMTGDSIQAFGMIGVDGAGVAFYKDLPAYEGSLKTLRSLNVEHVICSHDYRPLGYMISGADEVKTFLDVCDLAPQIYDTFVKRCVKNGITAPEDVAMALLDSLGVEPPPYLFMPMYTVDEHIKKYL